MRPATLNQERAESRYESTPWRQLPAKLSSQSVKFGKLGKFAAENLFTGKIPKDRW